MHEQPSPLILASVHEGDEIFKRHYCSYLIACQPTLHKDSNWSGLGEKGLGVSGACDVHITQ